MALRATIYLEALGPGGLRRVAEICVQRAHALAEKLAKIPGVFLDYKAPYFNEFVVRVTSADLVLKKMLDRGFAAGLLLSTATRDLRDHILVCCTEKNTPADLDAYAAAFKESVTA
jgi:glycine dehydrogenase subunit 1